MKAKLGMKGIKIILYTIPGLLLFGLIVFVEPNTKGPTITLLSESDTLHYIQIETDTSLNDWELPYPVYQFQIGDIDNNGKKDILVGVIKTTRFDSTMSKRLFIFKNHYGLVRPLWLGSRLGQELEDFKFIKDDKGARVRSIEKERSGKYLVAEYKWRRFGLEFIEYISKEINYDRALKLLND